MSEFEIPHRPRRNRKSAAIRSAISETYLAPQHLIYPLFLLNGAGKREEIASMPGIFRCSLERILEEIETCLKVGVSIFALFPAVDDSLKDKWATYSYSKGNFYCEAIRAIKNRFPEAVVMTDVAMDPYSSDGHDGLVESGRIVNDKTLPILGKMALAQAEAGADILGPSDMMDGRVGYIRDVLDENDFQEVSILSYSAKYASGFYGPFRDALASAPKFGDKKTYQMDYSNVKEALIEARLDEDEGADMLMVKPALAYLDVIKVLSQNTNLPIAAYQVSGEYAMIKAAAQNGWLDEKKIVSETLTAIRRAGASVVLTYFAKQFAQQFVAESR
ncbi:MAG TPA: porphobilinogen synthase [Catalimonadaceae bacterium]|jgi:porphobilinogen synthase|nr:porphobilinogen synthase [Catalimonadaceae bacterium]